ncbi:MAG TPA: Gldg family protein, partial [Steroidobacteraceae bacterium]|nr:Gldg family protein [Steroidobacteraceae bacterium]
RGVPVGATGAQLYLGLAGTNSTDGHAAIEFFDPNKEQFLEYDVVRLVYQLANPKKPVLAWLSTLPMGPGFDPQSGQMREPWVIYGQAEQLFEVRPLEPTATRIDPDVNVLVLVHPKNLSPATQFAIDQFALQGGHILAFVDPLSEADSSGNDPRNPMAAMGVDKSSHLGELLNAWGVKFDAAQVVADRGRALSVSMHQGEPPVAHLGVLGLDKASFSADDVITAGLSNVNVAVAGHLEPIKGAAVKFEPLLQSSTDAALLPVERFRMLFDPGSLREGFKPTGERYTLAARVSGKVHTAFPNGAPAGVTLPAGAAPLKDSVHPLNLVVIADTDLLADYLWVHAQDFFGQRLVQAWASNGDLVLNALDNLAGSADLISVRGRATFTRPFDRVEKLRRAADDRFRDKEHELEQQLQSTEQKLTALQSKGGGDQGAIVTPQEQQEIEHFAQEKIRIRKELRAVRAGLDADIRRLGTEIKIVDIIVIPAAFALLALGFAAWRRRVRTRRPAEARP